MPAASRTVLNRRLLARMAILALYAALALAATWPLAQAPARTLPTGGVQTATVPLFNLWTIWWNADRLRHGFRGYWNAPIFHPVRDSFAFSEPQPTTILVAPIIWLTGSRVLAYNVYLWLSLVLNAAMALRLLRRVGVRPLPAVGGGAAMLLLPIVHWQLDVLQLVPLWGILWTWIALVKTSRRPTLLHGAEYGAAFGITFLTCGHQGLFLAVLTAAAAWVLPRQWLSVRTWSAALAAIVVAAVLIVPVAARLRHAAKENDFTRTPEIVAQLSAEPGDYTCPSGKQLIDLGRGTARPFWSLSPGWIKLGLAVIGAALGLSRRRGRRWTAFLLITAVLAYFLSLGPNLYLGQWQPWWTLTHIVPGFSQVRNVFRFAFFVQMAVVLLAVQGVQGLCLLDRRLLAKQSWRYAGGTGIVLLALAALVETRPDGPNIATAPDAGANSGWIRFVREATPAGRAIACLPVAGSNHMEDYEVTTRWMYFGTFHHVPLVDGYSGFFPGQHFEIRDALNRAPFAESTLQRLADAGAEFLLVDRAALSDLPAAPFRTGSIALEPVFADSLGIDIYRIRSVGDPPKMQNPATTNTSEP